MALRLLEDSSKLRLLESPEEKPSIIKQNIQGIKEGLSDFPAQVQDLINIGTRVVDPFGERRPMVSKMATETIPFLINKLTEPVGTIPVPTVQGQRDEKGRLSTIPKIEMGEVSPTPIDLTMLGLFAVQGAQGVASRISWNTQIDKIAQTQIVRSHVLNNIEPLENILAQGGIKLKPGLTPEQKADVILAQAQKSPTLGDTITDLISGKTIARGVPLSPSIVKPVAPAQVVSPLRLLQPEAQLQPTAGGLPMGIPGREIPQQITKWMEKGVTISEVQPAIRIIDPEAKIKDINGNMVDLPKGHEMRPYKLSNGKIWLHDGKNVVVESGQLQKLKNYNQVLGESEDYTKLQETKVVDEQGRPKPVYSGHSNVAMYGKYDPKKSTAGGFYATEDPEIASNYATGKFGVKEYYERGGQYRLVGKEGKLNKKLWQVELTTEQIKKLEQLKKETINEYGDYRYGGIAEMDRWIEQNKNYDPVAKRAFYTGGSHNLQNIYDYMEQMGYTIAYTDQPKRILPDGKNLEEKSDYIARRGEEEKVDPYKDDKAYDKFSEEYQKLLDSSREKSIVERQQKNDFEELLDALGIKWNSYDWIQPGVHKVYLNIKNPLNTSEPFPKDLMRALEQKAKHERMKSDEEISYSHWTKGYPLRQWIKDIKDGNEFWSTHIPEKAVNIIKQFGYDGIQDTGGKMGGTKHNVWIAFDSEQIIPGIQDISPKQPMAGGLPIERKQEAMKERLVSVEEAKAELEPLKNIRGKFLHRIRIKGDFLKEELSGIPQKYITSNKNAPPPDEIVGEMQNEGIDIQDVNELSGYFIDLDRQIKELQGVIEFDKPKMVRMKETTLLKAQEKATAQAQKKFSSEMKKEIAAQARITRKLEKKAFMEGKVVGAEARKIRYWGPKLSKDERRKLWLEAKSKGLFYTDFAGKQHDKLKGLLKFYQGASFDQIRDYIGALTGSEENPPRLFKMTGNIGQDAELIKLIQKESNNWVDINDVEVNSLDPVRIVEKVSQKDLWDDNILADNTFNVFAAADEAMYDRLQNEITDLEGNKGKIVKGSKASAEVMRKFEAKEPLTDDEQRLVNYLRKQYELLLGEANEMRVSIGKKPIPHRQDYMTHIIEQNLLSEFFKGDWESMERIPEAQIEAIRKGDYTKGNMPFNRFALQRLGKKTKYDAVGNYETYLKTILKEIYYTPAITHVRKFNEYATVRQPNAYKAIDRLCSDLKGKSSILDVWSKGWLDNKVTKWMRQRIAKNALVANINFWLTNASNFAISYDELGNYMNQGMVKFLGDKKWRDFAFKNSVILKGRTIDPDLDPSTFKKIGEVLSYVTNLLEYNNVGSTFVGAYLKATRQYGLDERRAIKYADSIARRTQAGYKKYELPAWMRSNSGMLLSQFQTWSFNAMNHIIYDLKIGNIPRNLISKFTKEKAKPVRYRAFLTLVVVAMITNYLYRKMGLREPYKPESAVPKVPFVTSSRYEEPGVVRLGRDVGTMFTGKKKETRIKAGARIVTSLALPYGGAQVGRFMSGQVLPKNQEIKKGKGNKKLRLLN